MQLIWYRNDLRVDDHALLHRADRSSPLAAIYFFDPRTYGKTPWGFAKTGPYRARFIREAVIGLRDSLEELGIPLMVYHGRPEEILPGLTQALGIRRIYIQKEWTWEEKQVETASREACPEGVEWISAYQQFLFHPNDIPFKRLRDIPDVFTAFRKACEQNARVRLLFPSPEPFGLRPPEVPDTPIPQLSELGLEEPRQDPRSAFPYRGAEKAGRERLQYYFWESRRLSRYKKTRNGLLGTDYSSKFSPWLAIGALSPRRVYHEVIAYEQEVEKNQDTYWMVFELIWRDYFKYISMKYGNHIFRLGGILHREYDWGNDRVLREQWIRGQTPEAFVNANMRELAGTGWMSNRGRQNVASFWSRQLRQDWRIGASWFESMLIDYDVHSNWGNWMYNSGVGNDPRDRVFNIKSQAERYDPKGIYQRKWLENHLL